MSALANITAAEENHEHDSHIHHKQSFITKYVFSQDHKMIGRQYMITGIIMAVLGILMSVLFRIELAWPEQSHEIFRIFLGERCPAARESATEAKDAGRPSTSTSPASRW